MAIGVSERHGFRDEIAPELLRQRLEGSFDRGALVDRIEPQRNRSGEALPLAEQQRAVLHSVAEVGDVDSERRGAAGENATTNIAQEHVAKALDRLTFAFPTQVDELFHDWVRCGRDIAIVHDGAEDRTCATTFSGGRAFTFPSFASAP
jgi:hypothetical protein